MIQFLMLAFQEEEEVEADAPPVEEKKEGKKGSGKKG